MNLSMTTDYAQSTGCSEPYLRRIAEAGFTFVHWCHQWNTDFFYSKHEVGQIAVWLHELGLDVLDLHGSSGVEKRWVSPREHERLAGRELVENRIDMAAQLGAGVVIMHTGAEPTDAAEREAFWTQLHKSLDELRPSARDRGVRIAIENGSHEHFEVLRRLFAEYEPEYLGLCYDSGHGNVAGHGLDQLETIKDRLISVHLHDNDGTSDQHLLPFDGTTDWQRLAGIIAVSSYEGCVSMETSMRGYEGQSEESVLSKAFERGAKLARMIEGARVSQ